MELGPGPPTPTSPSIGRGDVARLRGSRNHQDLEKSTLHVEKPFSRGKSSVYGGLCPSMVVGGRVASKSDTSILDCY